MDTQRLILFVIFSFSLLMLWNSWQQKQQEADAPTVAPEEAKEVPAKPAAQQQPEIVKTRELERGAQTVVETDVLRAVIDSHGGDIRELDLRRYRDNEGKAVMRLFDGDESHPYVAQSGLLGEGLPSHKEAFRQESPNVRLQPGQESVSVTLTWQGENGVQVIKTYTFHQGGYLVDLAHTIHNGSAAALNPHAYYQFIRHGEAPKGEPRFVYTFTGPAVYNDAGKFQKVKFEDIAKNQAEYVKESKDGWIGMVQHHFLAAWLAPRDSKSPREFFTRALDENRYAAGMILPVGEIAPGASKTFNMRLYAGPQEQDKLKQLEPGLEYAVDYGWLTVIAYPLFVVLSFFHKWVNNWGVAIILLTILIKALFYPLSAASYKSMAQMRKLTPRLQRLKEQYGDDRQRLHEAMMNIYKEEKINPLGGCLPILVQIPVFIALYWVLLAAVEMRGAPFALWIKDLSVPDPYYVLPIIMGATMIIQTKLNPTPPDPIQAKVMTIMPVVFSVFFFFFPAGLVLYWLVNNILSILQQWRITRVVEGSSAAHGKGK
jgi:YidC/Oxa1 family membrane protein insertase